MGLILSNREIEVLRLVASDLSDREIAERLHLSIRTVNNHLRMIYAKLGVRKRSGAIVYAFRRGILDPSMLALTEI